MTTRIINYTDKKEIYNLFFGKSVKKVADDELLLSDGTVLTIVPNNGCGGCSSGNYYITELNECENMIMNVVLSNEGTTEDSDSFRIFVYADNRRINLLSVDGWDNGYYGQGYWIEVAERTSDAKS